MSVQQQLSLLTALSQFDFGRHLLLSQGVNGYWTHYMLTYPWRRDDTSGLSELESYLLTRAPIMLATQQRFEIFLKENQQSVCHDAALASIPSGMMGELLYLDFTGVDAIALVGIDYDADVLKDAWDLSIDTAFDLISSNGLNIYSANAEKVSDLYRQFYQALKPGGKLVTSFLTYPPTLSEKCEWDFTQINHQDLLLQKILFIDILEAKFNHYSSADETRQQLVSVGFSPIEFIYDQAHLFPTVVAYKPVDRNQRETA